MSFTSSPITSLEVDFLAIGEGRKSGDAIALRYGNLQGPRAGQTVVIIDGGTKDTGQQLVEHVQRHYNTNVVDIVFSTHPDIDHVAGLTVLLDKLTVNNLAMHQPWNHAPHICDFFEGRTTTTRLRTKLQESLGMARNLERIAKRRGIPIIEPFAGVGNNVLTVLGPSADYYRLLLADFEGTPEPHAALTALFAKATEKVSDALSYMRETFNIETLTDDGVTSSENNSSVILLLQLPTYKMLFTGDAGMPALTQAVGFAAARGVDLTRLDAWQIPHHGSKRNVGPTVLNSIKGGQGLISVAAGGAPKHPSKQVTNALIRRGTAVFVTQGLSFRHGHQAPGRAGWDRSAIQVPFYEQVEV